MPRTENKESDKSIVEWEIPDMAGATLTYNSKNEEYAVHAKIKALRDKFWQSPWITYSVEHKNIYTAIQKGSMFLREYGLIIDPETLNIQEIIAMHEKDITKGLIKNNESKRSYDKKKSLNIH